MYGVYDNGSLMLGNINDVIAEIEREKFTDVDMCAIDMEELLKELNELRKIDYNMIVCINYDNGMNYTLDYWRHNDRVKD